MGIRVGSTCVTYHVVWKCPHHMSVGLHISHSRSHQPSCSASAPLRGQGQHHQESLTSAGSCCPGAEAVFLLITPDRALMSDQARSSNKSQAHCSRMHTLTSGAVEGSWAAGCAGRGSCGEGARPCKAEMISVLKAYNSVVF
jgi:hypothetical protein